VAVFVLAGVGMSLDLMAATAKKKRLDISCSDEL
jgi:hypothetical protein